MRLRFLLAGVLVVGACVTPFSSAVADPSTNGAVLYAEYNSGSLWLMWLGGGGSGLAPGGNITATGVDSLTGQLFWADDATNKIMVGSTYAESKAELSTTGATKSHVRGLVVDAAGGKIYWANELANKISWAHLDGSGGGDINTTGATVSGPSGVSLDLTHHRIYWANGASNVHPISWADSSNGQSGGGDLAVTGATASAARGPSIDSATGQIYWANFGNNTISYANLDGSGGGGQLNVSGTSINQPHGTAIDPDTGYIYWINYGGTTLPISYAALDGSGGHDMFNFFGQASSLFPSLIEAPTGTATATGSSGVGNTLTCTVDWKPDDPGALLYRAPTGGTNYQWTSDGNAIGGATSSTYVIQHGDLGHELRCQAEAQVDWGPAFNTLTSNAISAENVVAERVFFADDEANTIAWATFDGSKQGTVSTDGATVDDPSGVAVDAATSQVWWANADANKISYADIGGAGANDLDVGGAAVSTPHGVAVDAAAGKVYWANIGNNTIAWANMDGSGGGTLDTSGAVVSTPTDIAVDPADSRVYWANAGDQAHQVSYANAGGGGGHNFDTSGIAPDAPTGVAVDETGSKVLWLSNSGLFAAGLNGGNAAALDTGAASFSSPRGLAIDRANGRVWWANSNLALVSYANLDGSGGGADIAVGTASPAAVAVLAKPKNTVAPSIGSAIAGTTLTCDPGTWVGDDSGARLSQAPASYAYAWSRDGTPDGGTDSTHDTNALSDAGHQFTCTVTASNAAGSVAVSTAAATVQSIPGLIYWNNFTSHSVAYATFDGGNESFDANPIGGGQDAQPTGIAIDVAAGRVYWMDARNRFIASADYATGANKSGISVGNATVLTPRGLVLDASTGRLYWANKLANKISLGLLSGGGGDYIDSGGTVNQPEGVAIDKGADRLYWANSGDNAHPIAWTTLSTGVDGGDLPVNGATASGASALAIDTAAGIVYWTNFDNNTVSYAHLDGSGGGQVDTSGANLNGPIGIAVDAIHHVLVVTSQNDNTVSLINIGATAGGSDLFGGGAVLSSPMYPALFAPPSNTDAPQVTGTAVTGAKLSCSQGAWAGDDLGALVYRTATSYAYQWTRDGADIPGATTSKLVVQSADAGKDIRCTVTATNGVGSTESASDPRTPAAYGTATKLVVTSHTSSIASGSAHEISVKLEDAYGNTVLTPRSITFAKASGSGTVTGLGSVDSSSGIATASLTGVLAGPLRVVATGAGLKSAVASLTVVSGPAVTLAFSTPFVEIRQGLSFRMKVFVEDAAGNIVTSAHPPIAFTSRGTGVVTGIASMHASKGIATVTMTAKGVGTVWIQAASHGLTPDTTKLVVFS